MQHVLKLLLSAVVVCELTAIGSPRRGWAADPPAPKRISSANLFAKGQLVEIDPAKQLLVVKTSKGPVAFVLTSQTKIFRGKGPGKIAADQLRPGETVAVSYYDDESGHLIVVRIKAAPMEVVSSADTTPASLQTSPP